MTPLEKFDHYLWTYQEEPDDGMSDLSSTSRPAADMTFGDLRALRSLLKSDPS